jgi:hypothetical protein
MPESASSTAPPGTEPSEQYIAWARSLMPDDETRNRFDTLRKTEQEQAEKIKQVQKERADGSWWEAYDTDKRLETLTQEYNNTTRAGGSFAREFTRCCWMTSRRRLTCHSQTGYDPSKVSGTAWRTCARGEPPKSSDGRLLRSKHR